MGSCEEKKVRKLLFYSVYSKVSRYRIIEKDMFEFFSYNNAIETFFPEKGVFIGLYEKKVKINYKLCKINSYRKTPYLYAVLIQEAKHLPQ